MGQFWSADRNFTPPGGVRSVKSFQLGWSVKAALNSLRSVGVVSIPDCTQLLQTSKGLQVLQTSQRLQKLEWIEDWSVEWSAKWSFAL